MSFPQMTSIIPECEKGIAKIVHRTPSKFDCMRAAMHRQTLSPRPMASLFVDGRLVMSDGDEEHRSNSEVVWRAHGNVLIAGLGIGMILTRILEKKEVAAVTVIEKYQDVIDLISPYFADSRLALVCADIFQWKSARGTKYDAIYFDIWPDITTDNLPEIATLHRRFKNFRAAGGWMGSWNHELLKYYRRQGR